MPEENDNETIKQMRAEIAKLSIDLKTTSDTLKNVVTERDDFKSKYTQAEREKLDELEKVKLEKADLETKVNELVSVKNENETLKTHLNSHTDYIQSQYDAKINGLPEEAREKIKLVTLQDGNPVESLKKLEAVLELTKPVDGTTGNVALGNGTPDGGNGGLGGTGDKKYDPKTVSWADGLRSRESLIADAKGQRGHQ